MRRPAEPYLRFFETLTPQSLDRLEEVVTPDVRFHDPFNDVVGVDAMRRVLAKMFRDVDAPAFEVTHVVTVGNGMCLVRWVFTARCRGTRWTIPGVSELHLDADGRVAMHVDHWDSGRYFYEKLPLVGAVVRFIRQRCAA